MKNKFPRINWNKANAELANKPFSNLFEWPSEYCVKCGRQRKMENMVHTRLYGYACVCGSQEWEVAPKEITKNEKEKNMKIYLVHPISGLSYEDVIGYYNLTIGRLQDYYEVLFPMVCKGYLKGEKMFAPSGIEVAPPSTDHAIYGRDMWMVKQADVVFADFFGAEKVSIGCVMEIAWASLLGKHVVTVMNPGNPHWHSFVLEATNVRYGKYSEAIEYLQKLAKGEL